MSGKTIIRTASERDFSIIDALLREWLNTATEREMTFGQALRNSELIVAEEDDVVVGFTHYAMHNDIIDGGPNAFITAFYAT